MAGIKEIKQFNNTLIFVILSGVLLTAFQYIFNRSLWDDEIKLGLNIINKSFSELLSPLDNNQAAPIGFLITEKLFVVIFGNFDYVLRILPLISYSFSLIFFYLFSEKILKSKKLSLFATAIYVLNLRIIYFSSEVKQYSTEVLFTLLIFHFCIYDGSKSITKSIIYSTIVGALAIWFSHVSVIVLFIVGITLLYSVLFKNIDWRLLLPILFWAFSFITYYILFIYNHPTKEHSTDFMKGSFLPLNLLSKDFYKFFLYAIKNIYSYLMGYGPFWIIPFIISIFGLFVLFIKKKRLIIFLFLMQIIVHLIVSSLNLYPFYRRFILYFIPLTVIIYVFGLYYFWQIINKKFRFVKIFVLLFPVIILYYPIIKNFPLERQEIKKCLNYLSKNIKKDDYIYIYHAAINPYKFYSDKYPKLKNNKIIYGHNFRKYNIHNVREIYREIDGEKIIYNNRYIDSRLKYKNEILELKENTWLLFSNIFLGTNINNDEKYVTDLLKENGYRIIEEEKYLDASIYKITK